LLGVQEETFYSSTNKKTKTIATPQEKKSSNFTPHSPILLMSLKSKSVLNIYHFRIRIKYDVELLTIHN